MKAVIYKLEGRSGNCYIGSTTTSLEQRISVHFSYLRSNNHPNFILQKAWNKHNGLSYSIVEEFEYVDKQEVITKEQYYLDLLKPKYNILKTAYRQDMTEEIRGKISNTLKGRKHPPERVRAIRKGLENAIVERRHGIANSRLVLNTETGIYYNSIQEAADSVNMRHGTLWAWLTNKLRNKSNLILV